MTAVDFVIILLLLSYLSGISTIFGWQHLCYSLCIDPSPMVLIRPSVDWGALSFLIEGGTKPRLNWSYIPFLLGLDCFSQVTQGCHYLSQFRLPESSKLLWSLLFLKLACLAVDWIVWDVQNPFSTFFLSLCYLMVDSGHFQSKAPNLNWKDTKGKEPSPCLTKIAFS